MKQRHVGTMGQGQYADLLGPAEGQYTTAVFTEFAENHWMDDSCVDSYAFTLREAGSVCITETRDNTPVSDWQMNFDLFSRTACALGDGVNQDGPPTTMSLCYDLPAGDYEVIVYAYDVDGGDMPWPYTLSLDSTVPLWNVVAVEDEACGGYEPLCDD